jgi:HEAT repeat protein
MRTVLLISTLVLTQHAVVARAQGEIKTNPRVTQWIDDLAEGQLAQRWNAAYRLGQLGNAASPATQSLVQSLQDKDVRVVWYSIYALGNIGEQAATAVPALREALTADSDSAEPKHITAAALGDQFTRRFAAQALGRIGPAAKEAAADLRQAISSDDASLRVAAALALWKVAEDRSAIEVLGKMLSAKNVNAAHEAAQAFTQLGSAGRPGIAALVRALNSNTEDVRRSAARALGQLGPVATPALVESLASKNAGVRRAAAQGFDWLGKTVRDKVLLNPAIKPETFEKIYTHLNRTAVAALRVALADDDTDVRRLAAEAIGSLGPIAIPTLVAALGDQDKQLRTSAALALKRIEARSALADIVPEFADVFRRGAVDSLSGGIRSDDPFVRLHAVRIFASLEIARIAPSLRPQLVRLLKDNNVQVRRYASTALRQIRNKTSTQSTTTGEENP